MGVYESWQGRVCMRVFSTLMSWSNENKRWFYAFLLDRDEDVVLAILERHGMPLPTMKFFIWVIHMVTKGWGTWMRGGERDNAKWEETFPIISNNLYFYFLLKISDFIWSRWTDMQFVSTYIGLFQGRNIRATASYGFWSILQYTTG